MEKKGRVLRFGRKQVAVVALILLIIVALEIYAHTYVHVDRLPVVIEQQALMVPFYVNGTYTVSMNGARWLFLLQSQAPTPSINYVYVYVFKMEQNESFLTRSVDLVPFDVSLSYNGTRGSLMARMDDTSYEGNYTVVRISYTVGQIGTYEIDFGLQVKVYEDTLLGFLPGDERTVPITIVILYGPGS